MNKNKKSIGLYLTLVAGIIAGSSNRPCGTFLCTGWFQ